MTRDVDPLLERIDRDLVECDASTLPALPSDPAAAVIDLAEQAGLQLDPLQQSLIRAMYVVESDAGSAVGPRISYIGPGYRVEASELIIDEVPAFLGARRRPWWRRWWSR